MPQLGIPDIYIEDNTTRDGRSAPPRYSSAVDLDIAGHGRASYHDLAPVVEDTATSEVAQQHPLSFPRSSQLSFSNTPVPSPHTSVSAQPMGFSFELYEPDTEEESHTEMGAGPSTTDPFKPSFSYESSGEQDGPISGEARRSGGSSHWQ